MRSFSVVSCLAVLWTSAVGAEPEGSVAGRLVFVDGKRQMTLREAEGEVGERITVELRHGASVVEARVDPDGYFVATGPVGRYRLEYLSIGERAEFLRPQELEIEAGALTCAGTLAVQTSHIEGLGANQDNEVTVTDECGALWPRLYRLASRGGARDRVLLARTGPLIENPERRGVLDSLGDLSLEGAVQSGSGFLRATVIRPLGSTLQGPDAFAAVGVVPNANGLFGGPIAGADLTVGGGYRFYFADLLLLAGFRSVWAEPALPSGPVLGAYGRVHFGPFGAGVRYELLPSSAWWIVIDFRPFALLGDLL